MWLLKMSTAKQMCFKKHTKQKQKPCFMDLLCIMGFPIIAWKCIQFLAFQTEYFTTPLITKYFVQEKGVRAVKISPSVLRISLRCFYTSSLRNYFIKNYTTAYFTLTGAQYELERETGFRDNWFVCFK